MAPPDLGLGLKLSTTKIISNLSKDPSSPSINDPQAKISRLEHHIKNLEEERRKIEVFKRELPLCMYLLDDVIGAMKEEVEQCRREPIQQFMPMAVPVSGGGGGGGKLEKDVGVKLEKDCKDKMNWMSSAQLWSNNYSENDNVTKLCNIVQESATSESDHRSGSPETKNKTVGAFVPFKGSRKDDKFAGGRSPDLSLVPIAAAGEDNQSSDSKPIASCHVSLQSCSQAQRKARRCWSPELHRRFVAALQQLGGAQVATPKQIRELMKVDGLTNDEVKSHLQKYRLHTRRMPAAGGGQGSRPVTMIGGFWAPQESNSQSGSPQGPLQLAGSSRAVSVTAGDSCEDNSKSESYSWK